MSGYGLEETTFSFPFLEHLQTEGIFLKNIQRTQYKSEKSNCSTAADRKINMKRDEERERERKNK